MTPEDRENRAAHAQALLDDPLMAEAWDSVERSVMQQWRASDPDDTATREDCWHQLRAIAKVRGRLNQIVADGKHRQPMQSHP